MPTALGSYRHALRFQELRSGLYGVLRVDRLRPTPAPQLPGELTGRSEGRRNGPGLAAGASAASERPRSPPAGAGDCACAPLSVRGPGQRAAGAARGLWRRLSRSPRRGFLSACAIHNVPPIFSQLAINWLPRLLGASGIAVRKGIGGPPSTICGDRCIDDGLVFDLCWGFPALVDFWGIEDGAE